MKIKKLAHNSTSYNSGDNTSFWSCYYSYDTSLINTRSLDVQIRNLLHDTVAYIEYKSICEVYQTKRAKRKGLFTDIKYQVYIKYALSNGLTFGSSNIKIDTSGNIVNPNVIIDVSLIQITLNEAIELIKDEIPLENIESMSTRHKNRDTPLIYEFLSYPDGRWEKYKYGKYCYIKVCQVDSGTGAVTITKRKYYQPDPKYVNVTF